MLPIRTTLEDVEALCRYLMTKPTGATTAEAKSVLDEKILDGRKISALKFWGFIEDGSGKMQLTERGRLIAKDKGARRAEALRAVVTTIKPYVGLIERVIHRGESAYSAVEVGSYWHQHFKSDSSDSDKILNDQAVCFFQVAEGADLGRLVVGRRGQPTRFEFDTDNCRALIEGGDYKELPNNLDAEQVASPSAQKTPDGSEKAVEGPSASRSDAVIGIRRVFITHGKNRKILDQIKELVTFGKFEPVVAEDRETAAKPVPDKVMDEMRNCQAAVIHVGLEGMLFDKDHKEHPQINANVLIEIGAAMALYRRNFILLVEDGVKLPSNLQGLYECRYSGNELNMPATMKLLKAFSEFS